MSRGCLYQDCPSEHQLMEMLEGRIDGDERIQLEAAIDRCPDCSALLIELTDIFFPEEKPARPRPLQIGRYEVLELIGSGGMGVIYKARDTSLRRPVALKLLRPEIDQESLHEELTQRLRREAHLLANLSHPNILTIYEMDQWEGGLFVASQFVDGGNLRQWMTKGPHPWEEVIRTYLPVASALAAAHERGVIHRDIKPDNILRSQAGEVFLADFGLARSTLRRSTLFTQSSLNQALPTTITLPGTVVGTLAYISPEQLAGVKPAPPSDQFSFCVCLYEALYGERPFAAKTFQQKMQIFFQELPPVPSSSRDVPDAVLDILQVGLRHKSTQRFSSMEVLAEQLRQVVDHEPLFADTEPRPVSSTLLSGAAISSPHASHTMVSSPDLDAMSDVMRASALSSGGLVSSSRLATDPKRYRRVVFWVFVVLIVEAIGLGGFLLWRFSRTRTREPSIRRRADVRPRPPQNVRNTPKRPSKSPKRPKQRQEPQKSR